MERPCFIEVKCGGEMVAIDPTKIEALLPGTLRYFSTQPGGTADSTVVRLVLGQEMCIAHSVDEVLGLIAEATKPENER
jgi:hypothetical protein